MHTIYHDIYYIHVSYTAYYILDTRYYRGTRMVTQNDLMEYIRKFDSKYGPAMLCQTIPYNIIQYHTTTHSIPFTTYHIPYDIPYTIYHIPCTMYHIPCTTDHVPHTPYTTHHTHTTYHIPYTTCHIPYTTYHI